MPRDRRHRSDVRAFRRRAHPQPALLAVGALLGASKRIGFSLPSRRVPALAKLVHEVPSWTNLDLEYPRAFASRRGGTENGIERSTACVTYYGGTNYAVVWNGTYHGYDVLGGMGLADIKKNVDAVDGSASAWHHHKFASSNEGQGVFALYGRGKSAGLEWYIVDDWFGPKPNGREAQYQMDLSRSIVTFMTCINTRASLPMGRTRSLTNGGAFGGRLERAASSPIQKWAGGPRQT